MSLIGGLVGGMIGFTFLGPLGALIGSVVGSRMGRNSVRRKNPNNFDHQVAFFAALFACLAKIAKADGKVTKEEINKIEDFITQKFNLDGEQRNFAINIFQKAKDDNVSFDAYAKQLASLLKRSPNSLMIFYELLFELAMADGELHPNEEKLLNPNESAYIPVGAKHRLSNPKKETLVLIEVQSGSYLGEDDIKRFEDKYGR